jgi:Fe-S cluster assembly protein SufD
MDLKKITIVFMAFEERVDVHSELHENFSHKTLKIKVSQPKDEAWKYTSNAILKMTLPFFKKKDTIEFNRVKILFLHEVDTTKWYL